MNKYRIAVDFGGTKATAVLFDENAVPVARCNGAGANINSRNEKEVNKTISSCLQTLLCGIEPGSVAHIYGWMMHSASFVTTELRKHSPNAGCTILHEGVMGAFACGVCSDAVIGLSGTGSGAFYVSGGEMRDWVGGWGSLLGDDGSGFSVGRSYLRSLIYNEEHGVEDPDIVELCRSADTSFREAVFRLYEDSSPSAKIASFARKVSYAAESGDLRATRLLNKAGQQLAEQILCIYKRNNLDSNSPLCLMGGLVKSSSIMQESLHHTMSRAELFPEILVPILSPVEGAVVYADWKEKGTLYPERFQLLVKQLNN